MPHTEKDEIMIKFASSQGITKNAASELAAANVAKALGLEAAITAGAAAIGAGAGAVAGTGAGAGAAGALAFGTGPIGWIVGAILLTGGVTYAIVDALSRTDNTVKELISRLEALDYEDTRAEGIIKSWILSLKSYKPILDIPVLSGTQEERFNKILYHVNGLSSLIKDLENMNSQWPQVKNAVEDWKFLGKFGDVGEAEITLKQTLTSVRGIFKDLKSQASSAAAGVLKKLQKETGADYKVIAQEVLDLYKQLTDKYNNVAPKFDTQEEKTGYALAHFIINEPHKINTGAIKTHAKHMIQLRDLMRQGLKGKVASDKPALSKRALTLGDGTKIIAPEEKGIASRDVVKDKKRQAPRGKNPLVVAIQRATNHLLATYSPQTPRLEEDGLFGPETAGHLSTLIIESKDFREALKRKAGLSHRTVQNYRAIRKDPEILRNIYSVLAWTKARPEYTDQKQFGRIDRYKRRTVTDMIGERGISSRDVRRREEPITSCDINATDLGPEGIDACLRDMYVKDPDTKKTISAYDFLKFYAGALSPESRADWTQRALSVGGRLPRPKEWIDWANELVKFVTSRVKKRKYRQVGESKILGDISSMLKKLIVINPEGKKVSAYHFLKYWAGVEAPSMQEEYLALSFGVRDVKDLPTNWADKIQQLVTYTYRRLKGRRRGPYDVLGF